MAVGKLNAVAAHRGVHLFDVVGADLVPKPARAGVDEHRHLIVAQPVCLRGPLVEEADHPL